MPLRRFPAELVRRARTVWRRAACGALACALAATSPLAAEDEPQPLQISDVLPASAVGRLDYFEHATPSTPPVVKRLPLTPIDGEIEGEPLREPLLGDLRRESFGGEALGERLDRDVEKMIEEEERETTELRIDEYWYRGAGHHPVGGWLIGKGNSMGMFSIGTSEDFDFTDRAFDFAADWAVHWVMGPTQTDMPPRLYDLLVRIGHRRELTDRFGYDLSFSAGFYADFEGSAREGVRFPSTAVTYFRSSDRWQWLLGVDILDRDDWFCLPVAGAVWTPNPDLRFDLVFPKPRVLFQLPHVGWAYFGAELWGGSWAIERANGLDDVATYRDVRTTIGLHGRRGERSSWFTQIGVAFDRRLEYRSEPGYFAPKSLLMLDIGASY